MQKGYNATGKKLWDRGPSLRYHVAHRGSRYYLCGCSPGIRTPTGVKVCFMNRAKKTNRWPVTRSTTTIWLRLVRMAYCRFDAGCKVYMYRSVTGKFCFNIAGSCREVRITDPEEALRKLKDLKTQGLGVPNYAIERLEDEIKQRIHSD